MSITLEEPRPQLASSSEVRCVTLADSEALVAMYQSFEPRGAALNLPPQKLPQRWLERPAACASFIAALEGRTVGHAVLLAIGDTGEVGVFIHQDFRGRGLGKRLLTEIISAARHMGLRRVWGVTKLDNVPMRRLAFSQGFTLGRVPSEYYLDLLNEGKKTN